jgi:hypothetical protein
MAKQDIWNMTFKVFKVNGDEYPKGMEQIREFRENIPGLIKRGAEQLAERFDFAYVEITAKSVNTGETFNFVHKTDEGFRDEWTVGRQ